MKLKLLTDTSGMVDMIMKVSDYLPFFIITFYLFIYKIYIIKIFT